MRKILIDLDVITVAFWDRNKEALKFLNRVKKGEFEVYTPHIIIDLVSQWNHQKLKNSIKHFYELYSREILTSQRLLEKFESSNMDSDKLIASLVKIGVQRDDAALALIASVFGIDVLITYNRKHLRNKVNEINSVLDNYGIRKINILLPSEI
jgi:predicted nucleic acid-binding protein